MPTQALIFLCVKRLSRARHYVSQDIGLSFGPLSSEAQFNPPSSTCHYFICPWKELRLTPQLEALTNFSSLKHQMVNSALQCTQ